MEAPRATIKISEVTTLDKFGTLMKDQALVGRIMDFARKKHTRETVEFLNSMKAGTHTQIAYDKYIKKDAPKEINISAKLAAKFHEIALQKPKPDWSKAPWNEATTEMLKLFRETFGEVK